ncbi:MAG: glutamine-hydrolyzing carbamoyl-phosphate synthase small subunit [Treponema sp.]|nr:glutamine-hydrolyzing carbamoyl-phosphate synthase small subunit [Treponema sp.]
MNSQHIRPLNASRQAKPPRQATLVLEDGSEFSGWAFGKARSQAGEVVFTTGMTGYPQSLTDPSFRGQILVSTYPLVGNYGVPLAKNGEPFFDSLGIPLHFESPKVQAAGFVVAEACEEPSHFACGATLSAWLEKNNVPGVWGIDTRSLTERLREHGVMMGKILVEGSRDVTLDSGIVPHPVADVSPREPGEIVPADLDGADKIPVIVLVDCGAKANIIRCLLARNVKVIRVPWNYDFSGLSFDGIFLSNGPGDPKDCGKTIAMVRKAFGMGKPIFGICLGNQIMALAAGADTYKLPYGHRGQNQPCTELGADGTPGRCYITSQNHGYAVRAETLPSGWAPWFVNGNDGTIEGIRSLKAPFSAVQFHPEGCPGPRDTEFLIDRFIEQTRGSQPKKGIG